MAPVLPRGAHGELARVRVSWCNQATMEPRPASPGRFGDRECPLSVEALVRVAGMCLEEHIGTVWVEGEVSNLRTPGSGHLYFVLKDGVAQVPAVMFKSSAARLKRRLAGGRGRPGAAAERGNLQLWGGAAEPAGLGEAALALEELKRRLAAEGLFD